MKILYFARLRQVIGRGEDELDVPASVKDVMQLIDFLKARDAGVAQAFANLRTLKVAVDQKHSFLTASVVGAREVAFFPPVTGG